MTSEDFRQFLDRPKGLFPLKRGVADAALIPPYARQLYEEFAAISQSDFLGVTTSGTPQPGLFELSSPGAGTTKATARAIEYVQSLTPAQSAAGVFPIDAVERRKWLNAFPDEHPHGVLMDDMSPSQRKLALDVVRSFTSAAGYRDVRDVMRANGELAWLLDDYRDTLREFMYWFSVFGSPNDSQAWAWQISGHHLDLNGTVIGDHMVLTPSFMGAEPRSYSRADGQHVTLFEKEIFTSSRLMDSFSPDQLERVILSTHMEPPELPADFFHPTEGRMRASVARDNVVLPYEGLAAGDMSASQRDYLLASVDVFLDRLPGRHRALRRQHFVERLNEAHFCWIGPTVEGAPFYYKIHSPVLLIEFDCHSGVFLSNTSPQRFHVHTIIRTPNGNDYGRELLRQHLDKHHSGREPAPSVTS